jgi:hypothetical protein
MEKISKFKTLKSKYFQNSKDASDTLFVLRLFNITKFLICEN